MAIACVILAAVGLALLADRLRCERQLKEWARQLSQTEADSNLRLGTNVRSRGFLCACRAVNEKMEQGKQARIALENADRELKNVLSCLSHDIRTPLTGASGYLQLLWQEEDADRREEYFGIIRRRLSDLESLLEELFLFSKLNNADYRIACAYVDPFPVLCDVMAGFYDSLTQAGIEPVLEFAQMEGEGALVYASSDALRRIFSNLLQNALRYGGDRLRIYQSGPKICFCNPVREGETLDTERIFDRFYRADGARSITGTGLGLASVKGLMQKMGGDASAALARGELTIALEFTAADKVPHKSPASDHRLFCTRLPR